MRSSPSAARYPTRWNPPCRAGAKPMSLPRTSLPSTSVMTMSSSNRAAPPRPSSGESSDRRMMMRDTGRAFWSVVRAPPLKGLPVTSSYRV